MKQVPRYISFDGIEFVTPEECRSHERRLAHKRLVGLTLEQLESALSWADADLAEAIELVAGRITRARKSMRRATPDEVQQVLDAAEQVQDKLQEARLKALADEAERLSAENEAAIEESPPEPEPEPEPRPRKRRAAQ